MNKFKVSVGDYVIVRKSFCYDKEYIVSHIKSINHNITLVNGMVFPIDDYKVYGIENLELLEYNQTNIVEMENYKNFKTQPLFSNWFNKPNNNVQTDLDLINSKLDTLIEMIKNIKENQ